MYQKKSRNPFVSVFSSGSESDEDIVLIEDSSLDSCDTSDSSHSSYDDWSSKSSGLLNKCTKPDVKKCTKSDVKKCQKIKCDDSLECNIKKFGYMNQSDSHFEDHIIKCQKRKDIQSIESYIKSHQSNKHHVISCDSKINKKCKVVLCYNTELGRISANLAVDFIDIIYSTGDTVTFTYTIYNTGNLPILGTLILQNTLIYDSQEIDIDVPVGATFVLPEQNYTITNYDICKSKCKLLEFNVNSWINVVNNTYLLIPGGTSNIRLIR